MDIPSRNRDDGYVVSLRGLSLDQSLTLIKIIKYGTGTGNLIIDSSWLRMLMFVIAQFLI